ncbi:hypothetical protein ACFCWD_28790 [Streptomyces sp. NPDC056374]|uniref:hypothetical protein n=1 Tax=unclassified Streptomyces TaxID=2593676 RepID=UPI0035DB63CB
MTTRFSMAAARQRLGANAVAAIERAVDAAPPLRAEQREQIRAVFATARPRQVTALTVSAPRAA